VLIFLFCDNKHILLMTGFRHGANSIFVLQSVLALLDPSRKRPISCPETSVTNYQSTLPNIPEAQISQILLNQIPRSSRNWRILMRLRFYFFLIFYRIQESATGCSEILFKVTSTRYAAPVQLSDRTFHLPDYQAK